MPNNTFKSDNQFILEHFNSGKGTKLNPIQLPEVTVQAYKSKSLFKNALTKNDFAKKLGTFVNDEILLNENNIRTKNAYNNPEIMDVLQEAGNFTGALVSAPLAFYTGATHAPYIASGLQTISSVLTPSTWINGLAQGFGYTVPEWIGTGADLATSIYFANEAANDINKEGLNFKTGFNALMSLAPITKDSKAIDAVSNGVKSLKSKLILKPFKKLNIKVESFPIFNLSSQSNYLNSDHLGIPISTKHYGANRTITKYEQNGIKYIIEDTPENSSCTILDSNNKVLSSISQKSREYIDNYILLFKQKCLNFLPDEKIKLIVANSHKNVEFNFDASDEEAVNQINYFYTMPNEDALILKDVAIDDIENVYLSDEYITKFMNKTGYTNKELAKNILKENLYNKLDNSVPFVYNSDFFNEGGSHSVGDKAIYGINSNSSFNNFKNTDWTSVVSHEFGHNLYQLESILGLSIENAAKEFFNKKTVKDINILEVIKDPKYFKYLDDPDEFRQRIFEGIRFGIKNKNLTPEEIYEKCNASGFIALKDYYKKPFLIKALTSLLTLMPIVTNNESENQ